jgi:transcriptional regulator GlxA family with amidase domain
MRRSEKADSSPGRATFFAALADVVLELSGSKQSTWLPLPRSAGLTKAVEHGLSDYSSNVELPELARIAALSERTLAQRFREELEMSWTEFRNRARMIKAMELLSATSMQVTQAGLSVAFSSTSAFIRAFRHFLGLTPHAYRNTLR